MENEKIKRKIIVTENFEQQAEEKYDFIYEVSPQNADNFADGIVPLLKKISNQPSFYPSEPYLPTQKNWYKYVLYMKRWKIIFKVTNNLLIYLGIIHTSRHPREIKKLRSNKYNK